MNSERAQRVDFELIKRTVPLAAILERYGVVPELKRVGAQLKGRCPVHKGGNPRQFVVDLNKNVWRCFSPECDRGGGMLELVAELERVEIIEAALLVAEWFCIKASRSELHHRRQRSTAMTDRPSHKCYVVEDKDDEDNEVDAKGWWTRVGSAWPHKDGKGLNVVLAAVPINGRLVLREYNEADAKADEQRKLKAKGKK